MSISMLIVAALLQVLLSVVFIATLGQGAQWLLVPPFFFIYAKLGKAI